MKLTVTFNRTHAANGRSAWMYAFETLSANLQAASQGNRYGEPICDFFDLWMEEATIVDGVSYLKELQIYEGQANNLNREEVVTFIDLDGDPVNEQFIKQKWLAQVWYHL